jgi:hypothetical protein
LTGKLRRWTALAALPAAIAWAGLAQAESARPVPADPGGAAGLLSDLERIVRSAEAGGWFVDETAYRDLQPTLLESVCRASDGARAVALSAVRERSARLGDPRVIFHAEGRRKTPGFELALTAERERTALERALGAAPEHCPFWVEREHGFLGRQTDRRRLTLNVETGGNVQFRYTEGRWTFGGGGVGRLLPGIGLGERFTLLLGAEFGGGAMLRPGGEQTEFVINYFPAVPLVLRARDIDWHYDLELGPVALFQADNTGLSYGGRLGLTVGVFALRAQGVIPWGGLAGSYEYYVEGAARPAAHFFRGGLRLGIIWDP